MKNFTITDIAGDNGSITAGGYEAVEAIRPWFQDAPQEISEALDSLDAELSKPIWETSELESYLGIQIESA